MEEQKNTRIFNPIKYFNQYYSNPDGHEQQNMGKVFFKFMYEIFEKLPQCSFGIEIGCGPVLAPAAFSSRKIQNLLLTDYNTECFQLISKWIQEDELDPWKEHFQIIKHLQKTQQDIKKRLKRSLLGCAKVDLTKEMIFQLPFFRKADIIISSLCFQAVAQNHHHFNQIIHNMKKYLSEEGFVFMIGVLGQSFFMIQDEKFPCLDISKQMLQKAFEQSGFQIITYKQQFFKTPPKITSNFKGLYCILAKIK